MKPTIVALLLTAAAIVLLSPAALPQTPRRKSFLDQEKGRVRITNGPVIESLKSDSATIAWSTNLKGTTEVSYGPKRDRLSEAAGLPPDGKGLMHRFQLKGLEPNTTYYFKVRSRNPDMPNSDSSKVLSFTTPALGAQARHNEVPQ